MLQQYLLFESDQQSFRAILLSTFVFSSQDLYSLGHKIIMIIEIIVIMIIAFSVVIHFFYSRGRASVLSKILFQQSLKVFLYLSTHGLNSGGVKNEMV